MERGKSSEISWQYLYQIIPQLNKPMSLKMLAITLRETLRSIREDEHMTEHPDTNIPIEKKDSRVPIIEHPQPMVPTYPSRIHKRQRRLLRTLMGMFRRMAINNEHLTEKQPTKIKEMEVMRIIHNDFQLNMQKQSLEVLSEIKQSVMLKKQEFVLKFLYDQHVKSQQELNIEKIPMEQKDIQQHINHQLIQLNSIEQQLINIYQQSILPYESILFTSSSSSSSPLSLSSSSPLSSSEEELGKILLPFH